MRIRRKPKRPEVFPTPFARNLWQLLVAKERSPQDVSLKAGLSRGYIADAIREGRPRVPGAEAAAAIAGELGCSIDDLIREDEPVEKRADIERHRANRRRALAVAEKAMGDDDSVEHTDLVFEVAKMIHGVIADWELELGRPLRDDEDAWSRLDTVARRWTDNRR